MTYAFTFDASACSGCKACQIACKDKNNLPTGVLWRRVYEVSGGSWTNVGADGVRPDIWETDVFAYNLSIACNHCVHPKCAGVCPTDAYVVRDDGIVYIDASKCMGCGYCAWACPYSAPQYNPELRHMTKCNFCFDNIDAGLPPACVAACPMRVLDYTVISDQLSATSEEHQKLWETPGREHPFPLPTFSRTQPHLALKPHVAMGNGLEKAIANQEESHPRQAGIWDELPLVIFTILAQMAAGMAVFSLFDGPLSILTLVTIGGLIGIGGLASLSHLGTPMNAWRAANHLRKSWLSREILMFGLFGVSWLLALALPGMGKLPLALTGIGLVYSMVQVYRFKAVPAWNTWQTNVAFFLSAGALGAWGVHLTAGMAGAWFIAWILLAAEACLALARQDQPRKPVYWLRIVCILLALGLMPVAPASARIWLNVPISILILIEELIGRWLFYEMKNLRVL